MVIFAGLCWFSERFVVENEYRERNNRSRASDVSLEPAFIRVVESVSFEISNFIGSIGACFVSAPWLPCQRHKLWFWLAKL